MFATRSPAIHEFLEEQRLVPPAQLAALEAEHLATGLPLADVVVDRGVMDRESLLRRVAGHTGLEFVRDLPAEFSGEAIAAVSRGLARDYGVMPWRAAGRGIDLLVTDPFDVQTGDELAFALDRPVGLFLADPDEVERQIARHYGAGDDGIDELLREIGPEVLADAGREELSGRDLAALAERTPIIRFVNFVLGQAIRDRASDVHFEPFEREFKIRYRVDGALYELTPPPRALALPVTSRLKVLANLNIAERRVPQDGRIKVALGGRAVDLRVSTLPTQFGESVVLRVLDQAAVQLDITQLGMPGDVSEGVREIVRRPNGIFIVTGPTGSGKTTTLYSGLRLINTVDLKVLTAEDPVEYEIEGIMQVPVNPAVGLTFAAALRSFLRQDPDVIMVGEIRDFETAQIAIQAALTGHLVLTTLHTNDAAGAITRLLDLGVEPFLIASTVEAVLAQRLVRRICPECKAAHLPSAGLLAEVGLATGREPGQTLFHGRGCPGCLQSGYRGRLGIYEWLRVTDPIRDLIAARAPTHAIREKAVEQGMRTLREDGRRAILDGQTTIEELIKCT